MLIIGSHFQVKSLWKIHFDAEHLGNLISFKYAKKGKNLKFYPITEKVVALKRNFTKAEQQ